MKTEVYQSFKSTCTHSSGNKVMRSGRGLKLTLYQIQILKSNCKSLNSKIQVSLALIKSQDLEKETEDTEKKI